VATHPPIVGIVVAILIVLAYGASLWWLLRRESVTVLVALLALCGVSLSLRLVYTTDFPAGLNEDEPKILHCAYVALMRGDLLNVGCTEMPVLLSALFQAQLVPVLGPGRWAIRSYSLVTSVLATPAAFAAARALMLGVVPSCAVGAFVAVLPWSLFYGRVSVGGELVFHELLLLAALARLVWAERAGWRDVGIGSLGLGLLVYDYFCGLAMLGMPLVAVLLAPRGRRRHCVAILVVAVAGYTLYAYTHPVGRVNQWLADAVSFEHNGLSRLQAPVSLPAVGRNALGALRTLTQPVGGDSALTIRSGALHPLLILGLAAFGVLSGGWRAPFLLAGFLGGLTPALTSSGVSAHRMLMAFPFIALAAGTAFNVIRSPRWVVLVTVPIVVAVAVQSVHLYFSPQFWPIQSRGMFSPDQTDVVESLPIPLHLPLVVMKQLGYFFEPRTLIDQNLALMSVDNWLPADGAGAIEVFDGSAAPLRPFYEQLVGAARVRAFGGAFTVSFEPRQWSWVKQHGWAYETRCGPAIRRTIVPVLYHEHLGFQGLQCSEPITHVWRARWRGAVARLRVYFNGEGTVETSRGIALKRAGNQATIDFAVAPGDELRVTVTTPPPDTDAEARVMEITPATERVPLWESVDPIAASVSE
jgi:hypothetical protein